jgi:anti-sigma factor RsiW
MSCQGIRELLPLFVEDDLPGRQARRVRRHLAGCSACAGVADEYRQSQEWLRASASPAPSGPALDMLRRSVWRRIEDEPRPAPLWLAIERGWAGLREWASRPAVAGMAVTLVVLGSLTLTRVGGLGITRLGDPGLGVTPVGAPRLEPSTADEPVDEPAEDPEAFLAQATPDELGEGLETGEAEPGDLGASGSGMRIELQTQDPNVRIIWFSPPAAPSAEGN